MVATAATGGGKKPVTEDRGDQQDTCQAANELGGPVKHRIPARDLAKSPESQRRRRIDVRPGLLSPRRVDDADRGQSHRHAHERTT
jgi:hypothetical protein